MSNTTISTRQMHELGLPPHPILMPLALETINRALSGGAEREALLADLCILLRDPATMQDNATLGALATAVLLEFPQGLQPAPLPARTQPAPWQKWGDISLEDSAIRQMENACNLPISVRGALMPDAHTGYGLPIGGVLAVRDAVIPYAVGVDIACRMRLSVLEMPASVLKNQRQRETLIRALEEETRFGMGAAFAAGEKRRHAVMDEDWDIIPVTARLKDKAAKQLGTSGGGNHFVEFGELTLEIPALGLEPGTYLALLSHSGSRGTGESVATHYSKLAMAKRPWLPQELKHLAWLEMDSAEGLEYWAAMELMGRYASANHELIHRHLLQALGIEALAFVENHHNFAWKENHGGEEVIVHRKGATPAGEGVLGIVPGSMGAPGFVVRGKGNTQALNSCSHGAGRLMSRTAAINRFKREEMRAFLAERGVQLLSGGLDEAPMAYKDIHAVMAAQRDLVSVLARFEPRLVKMAPAEGRGKKKYKSGKSCR